MKNSEPQFDVAVIGGGPAGMMAALSAAQAGARVVLIEKNHDPGRKLLLTGKGRCNVTQAKCSDREFVDHLGKNGKFIFSSLNAFGPKKVISFFEKNGLKMKTERGGRVFPATDDARDVLGVLRKTLKARGVKLMSGEEVQGFNQKNKAIESVQLNNNTISAKTFILCTGGKSYPGTGSTGDGFVWAKELGHNIIPPSPALVPIEVAEPWAKEMQGLSLKNVHLNVFLEKKKQEERFGEMVFTHFGLSGPIILNVSKKVGELLKEGRVFLEIDLKPALSFEKLDNRLQRDFETFSKKTFKNYLPDLLPKKSIDVMMRLSQIEPTRKLHSVNKEERRNLVHLLKELRLEATSLLGFDQAIITAGGIDLKEINSKTMCSKKIENLFFAGEVINLDGPTGGFNLQICWSTGHAAGVWATQKKE